MCLQGASRVAAALKKLAPGAARTFIVWVPMLPPDSLAAAEAAAVDFPNAVHFWDADRVLASELGRTLGITSAQSIGTPGGDGLAWDVYLAYGRDDIDIQRPRFWMHQLAATHAPRLDSKEFRRRVERLLQP